MQHLRPITHKPQKAQLFETIIAIADLVGVLLALYADIARVLGKTEEEVTE